jgi:hypothetical protein
VGAAALLVAASCSRHRSAPEAARAPRPSASAAAAPAVPVAPRLPGDEAPVGPIRFLVVGGGATPESTEVSLEQDVELVARTLPGPGLVLFAGGSGSESVRELDPNAKGDSVLLALGELWSPRPGRRSRYRPPRFAAGRASPENVEAKLEAALRSGTEPLLVYVAAHGDQGSVANENSIALWGGRSLTVKDVAEIHERGSRELRLVATSCFSGGFAELAFSHADERDGPATVPRCGLFAGTWDRETSGCDANPDRRAQESYGIHFIHALGGTDRSGHPLSREVLDFDGDGKIGLLDAHTRARIFAVSFDVPTTTSERFLRSVEPGSAPIDPRILPEDVAVTKELGKALGLVDEASVERKWNELDRIMRKRQDALDDAEDELDERTAALGARLLERWPVLDDAFHPDFERTLERNRKAIEAVLEHSDEAQARDDAEERTDRLSDALAELEVEEARVLRLRRAYETLHKAAALMRRGGSAARQYQRLLACERMPP